MHKSLYDEHKNQYNIAPVIKHVANCNNNKNANGHSIPVLQLILIIITTSVTRSYNTHYANENNLQF